MASRPILSFAALPDYLTQEQLSIKLQCDAKTLYRHRLRGLLPFVRLGRAVLYDPAAVAKALEKLTVVGRN